MNRCLNFVRNTVAMGPNGRAPNVSVSHICGDCCAMMSYDPCKMMGKKRENSVFN